MNYKILTITLLALVIFVQDVLAQGQCFINPITGGLELPDGTPCPNSILTAVPFLRITPNARSGGMGDVGIAMSPDANAMHFNPSNLAFVDDKFGIAITYTPWLRALGLNDIYMAYLSSFYQVDEMQTFGLGLRFFSLGEIDWRDDNGNPAGTGRPREFEVSAAYARKLGDHFSASLALKYIYSSLATGAQVGSQIIEPGKTVAGDLSVTYRRPVVLGDNRGTFAAGLAATNIGPSISYTGSANREERDFIPANLGIGTSLDIEIDDYNAIVFLVDFNKLMVPTPIPSADNDRSWKDVGLIEGITKSFADAPGGFQEEIREINYSVGIEYWYDRLFALRAGYFDEHSTKGNRKYLTLGLGLKYNVFGLDFSYLVPVNTQRNPLDNTLRFTLSFDFDAFEARPTRNVITP